MGNTKLQRTKQKKLKRILYELVRTMTYNYLIKLSFKKLKKLCTRTWFDKNVLNVNIGGKYEFNPKDWTNSNRYHQHKFAYHKSRYNVNLYNKIIFRVGV